MGTTSRSPGGVPAPEIPKPSAPVAQPASSADARHTAINSLGQATTMLMGGVLALLIARIFGKSSRTDAFFAAYGVAAVVIVFGQTFRLTALPKLMDRDDPAASGRLLAAAAMVALAAGIPMVVLADPVGSLLVQHDPGGTAPAALRVLWIAVAGQLVASMLAAMLAVRGAFVLIGVSYLGTAFASVAAFLALEGALGIQAVSVGFDTAAALLTAIFLAALVRGGWRPGAAPIGGFRAVIAETRHLAIASATYVAMNLGYVICVAVASRDGSGEATLYAYAYFSSAVLVSVTAVSAAMVRTPKLLTEGRSSERTAASAAATYRVTLVIVLPLLALAALVGQPVISFVLGDAFSHEDTVRLVVTLLCLSGWVLGSAAGVFAVIELLAQKRIAALALVAVGQIAVLALLAIVGRELWGIRGIALGQSLAMLASSALQLRLAFGRRWIALGGRMLADTLRAAAVVAAAFAPGTIAVLAARYSAPVVVPAALLSIVLVLGAIRWAWPGEWRLLISVVARQKRQAPA